MTPPIILNRSITPWFTLLVPESLIMDSHRNQNSMIINTMFLHGQSEAKKK